MKSKTKSRKPGCTNWADSDSFRNLAFTLNNYTDDEVKAIKGWNYKYLVFGYEICPTTATPHLQGYVEFKNSTKWSTLKKFNPRIHWGDRIGTAKQASDYCKEDGNFEEYGTISHQGKRVDMEGMREMIRAGASMASIVDVCDSYQAIRSAELLLKYKERKRDFQPDVHWFYGPSGGGKTRTAHAMCTSEPWVSGKNLRWWEGYDAHEFVIVDDFRKDFCTYHELLRILDRYEYRVEVKGGSRQLLAKTIIITCPLSPYELYANQDDQYEQLARRIKEIRYFEKAEGGV